MRKRHFGAMRRTGTGVRGNVEFRQVSEQYAKQKKYPAPFFVAVNVFLILLSVCVIFATVWCFTPLRDVLSLGKEEREVTLRLEIYDTGNVLSAHLLGGTTVFDAVQGTVIGEVVEVSTHTLEKEVVIWQEGWETLPENAPTDTIIYPVQIVALTVRATAQYRKADGYYTEQGERLYVGGSYAISVGGSLLTGNCVSLSPNEEVHS